MFTYNIIGEKMGRITYDPEVMKGKATIRGMRISVEMILEMLTAGMTIEKILKEYPVLEKEDILAALDYATKTIKNEKIVVTVKRH